jgi:phenylpropionate dioxygenase-like ring-hydroxylating dioxygenase large terminal subunit
MGNFIREYWMPALMSGELPVPDGPPLRLRILGENLIAFRVTSGKVGVIENNCPHRGTSLFYGRNEDEGLRCVYHGWKYDVTGQCVDMPSEPPASVFKSKVRARTYPCVERNSVVWLYMGSRENPPPLPDLPPNISSDCRVSKRLQECNYMQALEGDIDTVHQTFLHAGHVRPEDTLEGSTDFYVTLQRWMEIEVRDHEAGSSYAGIRPVPGADKTNWRLGHFILPFYTFNVPGILTKKNSCTAWVPVDDENTMVTSMSVPIPDAQDPNMAGIGGILNGLPRPEPIGKYDPYGPTVRGSSRSQFQPDTTDWNGRFRPLANKSNDYAIDRDIQASMGTWSGVPRAAQDPMAQESMGDVYDRTRERLATTDAMIIRTRRWLIGAAKALRDQGTVPPGVDKPELYNLYSGGAILPSHLNGLDALADILYGRAQSIEITVGST